MSEIGVEVADDDLRLAICDKPRKDLARLRCLCWRVGFIEMRRDKFDRHAIEIRIDQHITALRRQRTERRLKHVLVRKRVRFRPSNRKTRHPGARQHDLLVGEAEPCRRELKTSMRAGFGVIEPVRSQRIDQDLSVIGGGLVAGGAGDRVLRGFWA